MGAKVFVGLSGGVDSAVSAALLKEKGFDVVGVFIKIWRPEFIECTWKEDRLDAMRVCAALSIPYRELDLSAEYKRDVVDSMLRDYAAGFTPNPDVLCNVSIKFGAFAKWARKEKADFVATGHYARIRQRAAHFELLRGSDPEKDQSYFLHRLGQPDLARALFPVGGMKKSAVRTKAAAINLPVAKKHDSQGLCFVGDVSMSDFLRRFIRVERGNVVDMKGQKIGEHEGAPLYTIGERHGFVITEKNAARSPQYIASVNTQENILTVSSERNDISQRRTLVSDVHWVHRTPHADLPLEAQARYREKPFPVTLKDGARGMFVDAEMPHIFPPGQSLVLYQGDVCLGGGIIQKEPPAIRRVSLSTPQAVMSAEQQVQ